MKKLDEKSWSVPQVMEGGGVVVEGQGCTDRGPLGKFE